MNIELIVGDFTFRGWKSMEVTRSLRCLAGEFSAEIHEPTSGNRKTWMDLEGQKAQVLLNGEPVITAYLDDIALDLDGTSRSVRVGGLSVTGDLVDCSVPLGRSEFLNARLEDMARTLAAPFGIPVRAIGDLGAPIPSARVKRGETIFAFLERMAARLGCRVSSSLEGELLLFREAPGARAEIREGEAHISVEKRGGRFAEVVVVGEGESDSWGGGGSVGVMARARDASVRRKSRTLVLKQSGKLSQKDAETRAAWEVSHRLGESFRVRASVHGWTHAGGVWSPGDRVSLAFPSENLTGELVVETVRLSFNENGWTAELELVPPSALVPEPEKPESPKDAEGVW